MLIMGIGIKGAGITISGIAALYILNKTINTIGMAVYDISDAAKWRGYYKHGTDRTVPPGYERVRVDDPEHGSYEDRSPNYKEKNEKPKINIDKNIVADFVNTVKDIVNKYCDSLKSKCNCIHKPIESEDNEEVKDNIRNLFEEKDDNHGIESEYEQKYEYKFDIDVEDNKEEPNEGTGEDKE